MADTSMQSSDVNHQLCILHCQDEFIRNADQRPVGGVEALRICKEGCRDVSGEASLAR